MARGQAAASGTPAAGEEEGNRRGRSRRPERKTFPLRRSRKREVDRLGVSLDAAQDVAERRVWQARLEASLGGTAIV